jgi:outer membrane biosynthesis protein TonB
MRRQLATILPLILLSALIGPGCARPRPRVAEAVPPLQVPVVPPRAVAPLPEEPVDDTAQAGDPEPRRVTRPVRPRPRPVTPAEPPREAPKPDEVLVPEAPKAAEPAKVLRTPDTVDDSEATRRVRAALGRASVQLARVNAAALGADARAQFETARRFIDQAEGALRARNYVFASYLADKAETLARGLVGR